MGKTKKLILDQPNPKAFGIKRALLLTGIIPLMTLALMLSTYSYIKLYNTVRKDTFDKLELAAEQVNTYFYYDLENFGDVNYDDYADHSFIEANQKLAVEMTLFKGNIRMLTSLKNEKGEYNEGTPAPEGIWEAVCKGERYTSDDTMINGEAYYVCYTPMYNTDGSVWGMGFAGTKKDAIQRTFLLTVMENLVILVVTLVLFTTIIVILARKIYSAMVNSVAALATIATGELNIDTDHVGSIVEINQIYVATTNLKNQLTESAGGAKETATDLNAVVRSVDELANRSAADTSSINHSMNELSDTAQTLAETVQDTNSCVIDMGEAITSITDKAQGSASEAEDMRKVNGQVVDVITNVKVSNEKSVEAIKQIAELTAECKQAVEAIKAAADEITDIAEQTNLLALNASIESARAGEAGRGFAVVADSIKTLATESANTSEGISQRVNDIIAKVDKCVEASEAASAIMQEQNTLVGEAGASMDRLSESVGSVADNITVITDEAKRLDAAKVKVLNNITDLSAISEENAASCAQVSSSVDEVAGAIEGVKAEADKMRELAVQLEAKMEFFKL